MCFHRSHIFPDKNHLSTWSFVKFVQQMLVTLPDFLSAYTEGEKSRLCLRLAESCSQSNCKQLITEMESRCYFSVSLSHVCLSLSGKRFAGDLHSRCTIGVIEPYVGCDVRLRCIQTRAHKGRRMFTAHLHLLSPNQGRYLHCYCQHFL